MPPVTPPRSARTGVAPQGQGREHLLSNLLVLPGLGSLFAGRKVGWVQAPLALAGFALTSFWFVTFVATWIRTRAFPFEGGPYFRLGLLGVALFAAAWLWALGTGLQLHHHQRRQPPPPAPPPDTP